MAIDFERGDVPGQQKVVLAANNADITQEQLVKTLGDHAERYVVKGIAKQ